MTLIEDGLGIIGKGGSISKSGYQSFVEVCHVNWGLSIFCYTFCRCTTVIRSQIQNILTRMMSVNRVANAQNGIQAERYAMIWHTECIVARQACQSIESLICATCFLIKGEVYGGSMSLKSGNQKSFASTIYQLCRAFKGAILE